MTSDDVRCERHSGDPSAPVDECHECVVLAHEAAAAAEEQEVASGALAWAEAAAIEVDRLPDDLGRRAEAHYAAQGHDRVPGTNGLEAYVRHHWTNYEALLVTLSERFPAAAQGGLTYSTLRERIDEAVHDALDDLQTRCVDDDDDR